MTRPHGGGAGRACWSYRSGSQHLRLTSPCLSPKLEFQPVIPWCQQQRQHLQLCRPVLPTEGALLRSSQEKTETYGASPTPPCCFSKRPTLAPHFPRQIWFLPLFLPIPNGTPNLPPTQELICDWKAISLWLCLSGALPQAPTNDLANALERSVLWAGSDF